MGKFELRSGARLAAAAGLGLTLALGAAPVVAMATEGDAQTTTEGDVQTDAIEIESLDALKDALTSKTQNATWKLTADIQLDEMLNISDAKNLTIDGDGHTITASSSFTSSWENKNDAHLVQVYNSENVTIQNVKLVATSANKHVLNVYQNSEVALSGVSLDHTAGCTGCPLVINGSRVVVDGPLSLILGENSWYAANVDTKSGTSGASLQVNPGASADFMVTGDGFFYSGVYLEDSDDTENTNATVDLGDGTPTSTSGATATSVSKTVATVDGKPFSSLHDAVNSAKDSGESVELKANVLLSEPILLPAGSDVTINGNGYAIRYDTTATKVAFSAIDDQNLEGLQPGTKLTVSNATFENVAAISGGYAAIIGFNSFDTVVSLEGCAFKNLYCAVIQNATTSAPGDGQNYPSISVTNASFEGTSYAYSIDTTTDGNVVLPEAPVVTTTSTDDSFKGVAETFDAVEVTLTSEDGVAHNYKTIEDALSAAEIGDVITLQKDINRGVTIGAPGVTIKGNGCTITAETGNAITVTAGNVTLDGVKAITGSESQGAALVFGESSASPVDGNVTVSGGSYTVQNGTYQGQGAIRVWATGTTAIHDTTTVGGIHILNPDGAYSVSGNTVTFEMSPEQAEGTGYVGILVPAKDGASNEESQKAAEDLMGFNFISLPNDRADSDYVQVSTFVDADGVGGWDTPGEVPANESVAMIDGDYYLHLWDAVAQVPNKGTITLVRNCGEIAFVGREVTFTLELGGNEFTGSIQAADGYRLVRDGNTYTVEEYTPSVPSTPSGDAVKVEQSEGGKVSVTPTRADEGDEVTITATPDEGQEVREVKVVDEDGNEVQGKAGEKDGEYVFTMPDGAVTVTVAFGCDGGELCPTHGFNDVDQSAWYHDAVDWAVENGVLNGYGEGGESLGPVADVTRAEMAQMLWNRAGRPGAEADLSGFTDVASDGWYAPALEWCVSEGIFSGYGDTFGTERTISREEAVTVLWRLSGSPEADADLSGYGDASSVSDYAAGAVEWAVSTGVLTGKGGVALDPQAGCTRGEVAAMMMRMAE